MPEAGEYLYAFGVGTKAGLILGGGGITGGMYELGALSAMDDFIVSGRKSGDFDLYVGISAGSIPAAFLANGITVSEMCSAVLGKGDQGLLLRREGIYELSLGSMFRFLGRSLLNFGTAVRHIRKSGQPVTLLNILAVLQIEPSPAESSLFLYGSMNFAERIHSLNYGYNSSVYYFIENYDMLRECFARHGMEVSLERLTTDRFLQQAVAPAARRRFGLTRQKSAIPAGETPE